MLTEGNSFIFREKCSAARADMFILQGVPSIAPGRYLGHLQVISYFEIWGSHCGDYEECCLLGCGSVQPSRSLPTFRSNVPASWMWKNKPRKQTRNQHWCSAYYSTLKMEAVLCLKRRYTSARLSGIEFQNTVVLISYLPWGDNVSVNKAMEAAWRTKWPIR
jgi:hypothetical protein